MDGDKQPKLLDQVRNAIRVRHYSRLTEKSDTCWIRFFIRFSKMRHPSEMGEAEVGQFLTFLAVKRNVAASTQNQALNAIVFLYKHVLDQPLGTIRNATRAKVPKRIPVVFSHDEIRRILEHMDGKAALITRLMYGAGLRIMECLRLRVKDIDFDRKEIIVRNGKGGKDRVTVLPLSLIEELNSCIRHTKLIHQIGPIKMTLAWLFHFEYFPNRHILEPGKIIIGQKNSLSLDSSHTPLLEIFVILVVGRCELISNK